MGTLYQAMALGLRALKFSANAMLETETAAGPQRTPQWAISLNMLLSFAFFVFLYKFIPLYAVTALGKWYPVLKGRIAFNADRRRHPYRHFPGLSVRRLAHERYLPRLRVSWRRA